MRLLLPSTSTSPLALILLILSSILRPISANEVVTITITAVQTATATATATTSPEIPQDPSYTSSSLFKSSVLSTTNHYRAQHNASALTWNDTLADYAKHWAEGCIWEHSVCNPLPEYPQAYYCIGILANRMIITTARPLR
ncbi:hypothetical protein BJX68DRAFT_233721 [Aspergillus pseudodeflectus]|uniref:SCP domain-containing protein n=1 Tax=Aspergillus pseudodeflectus TaxID=176178 RepID=A0ABR4KL42_9EURO